MAYDLELLLRDVTGIEINWMEQYSNDPRIILHTDESNDFPYFRGVQENGVTFNLYEVYGTIYYSEHPMGWVKYFSHCGKPEVNEGGFCGAPFGVVLKDGTQKVLKGPWSSRAEHVNLQVGQDPEKVIADVAVRGRYLIGTGIKLQALLALLEHFKFPYYLVRQQNSASERNPVAVSLKPDALVKQGGKDYTRSYGGSLPGVDVLYSPKED